MITSLDEFIPYLDGIQRRTLRDISALPENAMAWSPAHGEGENSWSVGKLVAHIAATRTYFVSAFAGRGWQLEPEPPTTTRAECLEALTNTMENSQRELRATADDRLTARIERLGVPGEFAAWRVLFMMVEHEVHHRSQIDTYAGLNGWEPPQLYERRWEDVLRLGNQEPTQ